MTITNLITTGLAAYRLTRLIVQDEITQDIRDKIFEKFPPQNSKVGYLFTCPWCISIWVGVGLTTLEIVSPKVSSATQNILAASAIAGIVSSRV